MLDLLIGEGGDLPQCRDEDERGSLEPGKFADLAVLDTDPFADGPEALLEARVLRTVVGGRTVFEGG